MYPTAFGLLTAALGLWLLVRSGPLPMLRAVMLLSLMGGSAAIALPALGGSTIQPAIMALGFLALRCLLPDSDGGRGVTDALRDLAFLAIFAVYGAMGAFVLPKVFAGAIEVTPLRPNPDGYIYSVEPLAFSNQNVTVAVYMLATLIAAVGAHRAMRTPGSEQQIARTAGVVAGVHALLGLSGVILAGTAWTSVLRFFRNGFYAQLDQSFDGFVRMTGIWPEPAVFAAFGFGWLVFSTELWLRNIEPKWTGSGSALLGLALLVSTSSTAYLGLGAYGLILVMRVLFIPKSIPLRKALLLASVALVGLAAFSLVLAMDPDLAEALGAFVARFTVDKAESASALQRAFWAKQGIAAFWTSAGLGIGAGSFRSSSIATAILGSVGIIGTVAFVIHLARAFKPLRPSTYIFNSDPRLAVGAAAGWAMVMMLIPSSFSAATPDPGFVWGMFGGIALALRKPIPSHAGTSDARL